MSATVLSKSVVFRSTHRTTHLGTSKFVLTTTLFCVISSFRSKLDEKCVVFFLLLRSEYWQFGTYVSGQNTVLDGNDSLSRKVCKKFPLLAENSAVINYIVLFILAPIYEVALECSRNHFISEKYKRLQLFKLHFLQNSPLLQLYTSVSECKCVGNIRGSYFVKAF